MCPLVELRQVKYRGNLIEQDHRFIKRLRYPWDQLLFIPDCLATLQGYEATHGMRNELVASKQRRNE